MRPMLAVCLMLAACSADVVTEPSEADCPPAEPASEDPCGVERGPDAKIYFEGDCACLLDCPVKPGCARRECTLEGIDTDAYWGTCSWSECSDET